MEPPKRISPFTKAILAAVLASIIAAAVNLAYNLVFRAITDYTAPVGISFLTITFGTMFIFLVEGIIFFFIEKKRGAGHQMFKTLFLVLTVAGALLIVLSNNAHFGKGDGLVTGLVIFTGLISAFMIPYLYNHPKMYI